MFVKFEDIKIVFLSVHVKKQKEMKDYYLKVGWLVFGCGFFCVCFLFFCWDLLLLFLGWVFFLVKLYFVFC